MLSPVSPEFYMKTGHDIDQEINRYDLNSENWLDYNRRNNRPIFMFPIDSSKN